MAAGVSALFLCVSTWGRLTDGFRSVRTTPEQRDLLDMSQNSPKRLECHTRGKDYRRPANACEFLKGTVRWAVLGDGHASEARAAPCRRPGAGINPALAFGGCDP